MNDLLVRQQKDHHHRSSSLDSFVNGSNGDVCCPSPLSNSIPTERAEQRPPPKRKQGLCLAQSPVIAVTDRYCLDPCDVLTTKHDHSYSSSNCDWLNPAPNNHRATFSGSATQLSIINSALQARELTRSRVELSSFKSNLSSVCHQNHHHRHKSCGISSTCRKLSSTSKPSCTYLGRISTSLSSFRSNSLHCISSSSSSGGEGSSSNNNKNCSISDNSANSGQFKEEGQEIKESPQLGLKFIEQTMPASPVASSNGLVDYPSANNGRQQNYHHHHNHDHSLNSQTVDSIYKIKINDQELQQQQHQKQPVDFDGSTNGSSNKFQDVPLNEQKIGSNNGNLPPVLSGDKLSPLGSMGDDGHSVCSKQSKRSQRHANLKPPFPMAGILLSMVASLFFSLSVLCVKLIPDGNSFQERTKQLISRGILMMIFCSCSIIYTKSTFVIKRDELVVNMLRNIFGYAAIYGAYVSLIYIPIGEAQAIIFLAPIWTTILGFFILGEKFSWSLILALPVSLFGLIMIAHPDLIIDVRKQVAEEIHQHHHENQYHLHPHNHSLSELDINGTIAPFKANYSLTVAEEIIQNKTKILFKNDDTTIEEFDEDEDDIANSFFAARLPGILIAMATSFLCSCVFVVLKFRKKTSVQTATFHLGLFTLIASLIISCFIGFGAWPKDNVEWLLLLGNGAFSWCGQMALQNATAFENASLISVLRSFDVVFSFIYSAVILDEDILWTSVAGSAIILAVVAFIIVSDYITANCCKSTRTSK